MGESSQATVVQGSMVRTGAHLALALLVVVCGLSVGMGSAHAVKPGAKAPRVQGKTLRQERPIDTNKLRGKVVVVDFWASWCKPCEREIPLLSKLADKHKTEVVVVGISVDNERGDAKKFIERLKPTFVSVHDGAHESAKAFAPSKMPSTFVIDKRGVVRFVHSGFAPGLEKELEREVSILASE